MGPENSTFMTFDPASNPWDSGSHSLPIDGAIVRLPDGRYISLGGYELHDLDDPDPPAFLDQVHVFNPRSNEWSDFAPLLSPREAPGAVVLPDGRVFVVGGLDGIVVKCNPNLAAEIYTP
jgi:hypothetical protein